MKFRTALLSMALISSSLASAHENRSFCERQLLRAPLWKHWEGEAPPIDPAAKINAVILEQVGDFLTKKKRLPQWSEIERRVVKSPLLSDLELKKIEDALSYEGTLQDIESAIRAAGSRWPESLKALRDAAAAECMNSLKQRLRFPSASELAEELGLKEGSMRNELIVTWILGDPAEFFEEAKKKNPEPWLDARRKITTGFTRAMLQTDHPVHLRTEATRPSSSEILMALTRAASNKKLTIDHAMDRFTLADLEVVLGIAPARPADWMGWTPKIFDGVESVETQARLESPAKFSSYIPELIDNRPRMEELKTWLENKGGALVTSVTPGVPIRLDQLAVMERYAEDLDYPIVVMLTAGRMSHLDPRLFQNKRIFVLTHTIENDFFRAWNIRIPPKNQNPLSSLDKRTQFKPGQTVIVGHSQLALRIAPTGSNHLRQAAIWSTGSLSEGLYPYKLPIQDRSSQLAGNFHKNAFLVLQKADARSGPGGEGVQNVWHVRPVEFVDDRAAGGKAGFTDLGQRYFIADREARSVQVETVEPQVLVMGDIHEYVADQGMMRIYREILKRFPGLRSVIPHDKLDGTSHNRHEFSKQMLGVLIDKFRNGELDLQNELMGQVQFINATHDVNPNIQVSLPDDNHGYWLGMLLDNVPQSQAIINGPLIAELTFAKRVLGIRDPLEYFLIYRKDFMSRMAPALRERVEADNVFVSRPDKVRVLPFGQAFVVGPEYRPVHLNFHGHQGRNGAKPSAESHAAGSEAAITGDSHRAEILGNWLSVGTSTPKKVGYNDGGYSSWSNAFALVYPDGTKQLLIYDSLAGDFESNRGGPIPSKTAFFGGDPLQVKERDNEKLDTDAVEDQQSLFTKGIRSTFRD